MRTLICCVAVLSAASLGNTTVSVAQSRLPLLDAVRHFQSVWGVDFSYASNTLQNRYTAWSAPIAGDAESDIEYLLEGTGVSFFRQPSGTFFLQPNAIQTSTLTGQVRSMESGTPLRGVHIALVGTQEGTTSNLNGQFTLSTQPRRSAKIRISHIGYLTEEREVSLPADSVLTIKISLSEWILEERPLEVTATPLSPDFLFTISDRPYEMDIRGPADLRQITGLGTSDVVRNLRDIAGIYVDLNTSDIHLQGGGLGEHQFRLDESAVFEPIHLGLFGVFNPFAIDQVTVRKAGFNVEHGSYLAGIINAEHSLRAAHPIEIQIDPISFNARITNYMDIGSTNLSLMGAFRSSIWDHWWSNLRSESVNDLLREWNRPDEFLMRASIYPLKRAFEHGYNTLLGRLQKIPTPSLPDISFNDIHAAAKLELDDRREIGGSLYRGHSEFQGQLLSAARDSTAARKQVSPDRHAWMNQNTRLYWDQHLTDNFSWRISWRKGKYFFSHNYGGLDHQNSVHAAFQVYRYNSVETSDKNEISSNDLSVSLNQAHDEGLLQAGLDFSWIQHQFSIQHIFPRVLNHERSSHTSSAYLQQIWSPRPWVDLTTGLRFTWLRAQNRWHVEPRTALLLKSPYKDGYGVSLRLSSGIYYQFMNQFEIATVSPSTIVPSTRFWIPVDETLRAPISHHYSTDLSAQLWTNWQFGFEYYYKDQRRLYRIDYPMLWRQDRDSTIIDQIDAFVSNTDGFVYGASFELRRNGEKVNFALRYERSESKRKYTFQDGIPTLLPVPWNAPQQLQTRIILRPIPALEGTIRWHGTWGRKWAFKRAYYDLLGSAIDYAASFDDYSFNDPTAKGHALAPFSQFDIGLAAIIRDRTNRRLWIRIDLLNAFDRLNPAYRYLLEQNEFGADRTILADRTSHLIGRTFTVSAQLQW